MGSGTFFSKVASHDPLAQALDLPGAHKYAQQQASQAATQSPFAMGPYTGVTPTLAGANAGYAAGGPGSVLGARTAPNAPNAYVAAARNATQQQQPPMYTNGNTYG